MHAGLVKRIAASAFVGLLGGTLAPGTLWAQAPANAPELIFGVWSETPECRLEDNIVAIAPRVIVESGARVTAHTAVTLAPAADGVLVTPVRNLMSRNGRWVPQDPQTEGRAWVFQRRGETLVIVRMIDRDGRDQAPPDSTVLHACR